MWRFAVLVGLIGCKPPAAGGEPVMVPAVMTTPEVAAEVVSAPPDRDADGVVDANDVCPDEPEDVDWFDDADGCVDRDNDRDGVVDAFEWKGGRWTNCDYKMEDGQWIDCRDRPEDRDGFEDGDGCPDGHGPRLPVLGVVHHDRRGTFTGEASAVFAEVAAALHESPRTRVWVDAHVDPRRDYMTAKRASQTLAERAIEELVRLGIGRERLMPRGMGHETPMSDNKSEKGRAANRRVEFNPQPPAQAPNECV